MKILPLYSTFKCLVFLVGLLMSTLISISLNSAFALDLSKEPIKPIPVLNDLDRNIVELGERLFHEPRLSSDDSVSCASCHGIDTVMYGADPRQFSTGVAGRVGTRNSPTIFNSRFNFRQLWDGRARTLEDQLNGVIKVKSVMDSNWEQIIGKLKSDQSYVDDFAANYADGMTAENMVNAIVTYERSLITPDSPFDRYLNGDELAISDRQKNGYRLFKHYGCSACHQGINVGGNLFQVFGALRDVPGRSADEVDTGRFKQTGKEEDKFVFRVPSLRLAARTAPYFHDGSAATLEEAVNTMIYSQLGRKVPDSDRDDIIDFLDSLVGKYKGKPL